MSHVIFLDTKLIPKCLNVEKSHCFVCGCSLIQLQLHQVASFLSLPLHAHVKSETRRLSLSKDFGREMRKSVGPWWLPEHLLYQELSSTQSSV